MQPFKVIARYKPTVMRASVIGADLTGITEDLGYAPLDVGHHRQNRRAIWYSEALHAEVRRTAVSGSEGTSWHQDGDTSPGANMDCGLVLWSNKYPTEFRVGDEIYSPKEYEVVYVRNLDCLHRRNPSVDGKRWSFRQRVV